MKKAILFFRDILEIYVPVTAFFLMFSAFILQVFFRYVLNNPLTWTNDIIVIGFVWTVIFGACYTMRGRRHVKFTLLYEKFGPRMAAAARLAGNIIIVVTFAVLIVPSINYAFFLKFQKTPVFRISYAWIFLPFAYLMASVVGYTIPELVEDARVLSGALPDSEDHARGGF